MDIKRKICLWGACLFIISFALPFLTACSTEASAAEPPMGEGPGGRGGTYGSGSEAQQQASSISVNTVAPSVETLALYTDYIGTIEAAESVNIYPGASGKVSAIYFEAGQTVQAGDLLFELDNESASLALEPALIEYQLTVNSITPSASGRTSELTELQYQNQLEKALRSYNTARETLELLSDSTFDVREYQDAKKALASAENAYYSYDGDDADYRSELWEAYDLALDQYNSAIGGYSEYYSALTNMENAYNDLEAVRQEYEIYQNQITPEDTTANQLKLRQAELKYQSAQKDMEETKVYAPIGGLIESRSISLYSSVSTSTAAFSISNQDAMAVEFNVSADGASSLSIGDQVTLTKGSSTFSATITGIDSKANSTGLFPVSAEITQDNHLLSGVSVKVSACTAKAENALVISVDSIYYEDQKPYVYLFVDGKAVQTFIELGITTSKSAEVRSGLDGSAQIITTWHPDLADGVAVSLKG